jgi:flagellar hook-associated protein 2
MTISSSVCPVSGIDYGKLIDGLTGLMQKPIDKLGTRLETLGKQSDALTGLATLMTGLKLSSASFTSAGVFRAASATPANPSILSAVAGVGTTNGNYSFNVQRLASASQQVSQGFADQTSALGLTGALKLQLGGGKLDDVAKLSALNGGTGVARGSIRVTDRSGASSLIDLSHAVDVKDVVNTINSATGVNVLAKLDGDRLVLTDNTGGAGTLVVTDAGGTSTASDLGLTAAAVNGTLTGNSLTKLKATTGLDTLNDGLGVRIAGTVNDFSLTGSTGSKDISLDGAKTLNDVIAKINAQTAGTGVSAAIAADGHGINLTDAAAGAVTVSALNGSLAASDLGILGSATGTLAGDRIASALTGPLLKNLRGGDQGQVARAKPLYGTLTINGETLDLSAARTLDEVMTTLNSNSQGVTASLNNAGTGITLTSNAASFTVADGTGNVASFLNIAGTSTATATGSQLQSGDERLRYLSENTRLATLNGGAGVKLGLIRITAPALSGGATTTLNVDLSKAATIGDAVKKLNQSGLALTARVNDTGDGILLTQTSGTSQAKIEDVNGGSTAKDLGIAGTLKNNLLDGSFQKTVTLAATDTLSDIAKKVNDLGMGATVSIINDGSGNTPFRLSFASRNSGAAGRLILDGGSSGISTTSLVQGQDAVLVYGGDPTGKGGLVATNSTNIFTGIVPGLTLTLNSVGATTVTVNRDDAKIKDSIASFVESYNKVIDNIAEVTKFDPSDQKKNGVLFGNSTVQQVENALGQFVAKAYSGVGQYKTLASVGIKIGQDGKLSLDDDKLATALAANPDDVRTLFTTSTRAVAGGARSISAATKLADLGNTTFPAGHISITDGFGTAYDVNLTSISTIGDVISRINAAAGGKVTAGINATGDGLLLAQIGGTGNAKVDEVGAGTTASALNIKGVFANNALNGAMLPVLPKDALKGIGATLSDLLDRFTNGQSGIIFRSTDAIGTQETQIKARQTALAELLLSKKERLNRQYAMLEANLSNLKSQGNSLSNLSTSSTKSS